MSDIKLNFEQRQLASEYAETHDVSDEVAYEVIGLSARVEELEEALSKSIMHQKELDRCAHITTEQLASGEVVLLTQGQIDWAWRVASSEEPYTDDCLAELGIVACEECGGSGMIGNPSSSDQVCICHDCGGHGWVWKEVTKDEQ